MTEDTSGAAKYAGNSNRDKEGAIPETPKVEKIVTGEAIQRKKPLGRRIAENFTGADAQSVGQYVLIDVIIPRIKDLIFDIGESALRRSLFGDTVKGYSPRGGVKGYTPYNTISSSAIPKNVPGGGKPVISASDEFGEIIVETRGEAQAVQDKISNLIELYGMACVSDLKVAVGITPSLTDEKWGWMTMGGSDIRRVGGPNPGYVLIFPRPQELP